MGSGQDIEGEGDDGMKVKGFKTNPKIIPPVDHGVSISCVRKQDKATGLFFYYLTYSDGYVSVNLDTIMPFSSNTCSRRKRQ